MVPEVQCAVKRKEKKAQKEKDKPNSTTNGSPDIIKIEPEVNINKHVSVGVLNIIHKSRVARAVSCVFDIVLVSSVIIARGDGEGNTQGN